MEISYTMQGDYLIPDLTLPLQNNFSFGRYGKLRKDYLKKHESGIYSGLIITGKLNDHLAEIDKQSKEMFELLINQLAKNENITEQLKALDQLAWVGAMNNIKARAVEIVLNELIYVGET